VISVGDVDGTILLQPGVAGSELRMMIPVQSLVVDDAALRSEEGEEFASEPSERDIARTRSNMLGDRVLNVDDYPTIRISGEAATVNGPEITLDLSIELVGRVVTLSVPATLMIDGDLLACIAHRFSG
jgi:polyisoprenoid-binding protein YceI